MLLFKYMTLVQKYESVRVCVCARPHACLWLMAVVSVSVCTRFHRTHTEPPPSLPHGLGVGRVSLGLFLALN